MKRKSKLQRKTQARRRGLQKRCFGEEAQPTTSPDKKAGTIPGNGWAADLVNDPLELLCFAGLCVVICVVISFFW